MKTCLVVDDSSVIRKVARRILEGLSFGITEAEDGQQALDACKRDMPDAVLLDWNMPVMDGYEFLKALRRMPGGDKPKVVFCTTETDVVHIARALHAGANEYIMKPFDKEIVESRFREVGLIWAPPRFKCRARQSRLCRVACPMSLAATIAPAASASGQAPIRVMVVDDAVVVRGLVSRWIDEEPGMQVVASLRTGRQAVDQLERTNPDVVILDAEMPDLDGLSALPLLLEKKRDLVVIMASTLTRRNAEVSLKALSYGAADYIPKPETNREVTTSASFRRGLIEKIRQLGGRRRRSADPARRPVAEPAARAAGIEPRTISDAAAVIGPIPIVHTSLRLRPFSTVTPRVLLIGSSTGGPQALTGIMPHLAPVIDRAPVLIIQHMPPTFTTILAEHLARAGGRPAHEAVDGEPVVPGKIYIAPGGRHMRVIRRQPHPFIALDDGPPVNF